MKIIQCEQGSPEWTACRIGIPTCSAFDRIVTPTGKPSSGAAAAKYLGKCCAEWYLNTTLDDYESPLMERGVELEATAVKWYEFETDVEAAKVGFCLRDDGLVGGSPDRLIGEDGILEIKCPGPEVHMTHLLSDVGLFIAAHRCQVQGLLWLTGRKWCDLLAWSPILPPVKVRCEPDPEFMEALAEGVDLFVDRLECAKRKMAPLREERMRALAKAMETADMSQPF